MAIWQFPLLLIPKNWQLKNENTLIDKFLTDDGWDFEGQEVDFPPLDKVKTVIDTYMPVGEPWCPEMLHWGDYDADDVQIFFADGLVESIEIRISVYGNYKKMIIKAVKISKQLDCLLLIIADKKLIRPDIEILETQLVNSQAYLFHDRPELY